MVLCFRGTFHWIWLKIGDIDLVGREENDFKKKKTAWKWLAQPSNPSNMIIDLSMIKIYRKLSLTQNYRQILNNN